jgi:hypothetical protein
VESSLLSSAVCTPLLMFNDTIVWEVHVYNLTNTMCSLREVSDGEQAPYEYLRMRQAG